MKVVVDSEVDFPSQSSSNSDEDDGVEANSLSDQQFVVVKLGNEDEDEAPETEMDLSIFAPVESSECEEDEDQLSDSNSSCVSTWRNRTRERESCEDAAERTSSRRSLQEQHKTRKRQKQTPTLNAANRGRNKDLHPEESTFYQAVSESVRGSAERSGLNTTINPLAAIEPPAFSNAPFLSKSGAGEEQQGVLLEILNHCRFLHAAVQRLEQKIDRQMSNEPPYQISTAKLTDAPEDWYSVIQRLEDKIDKRLPSNSVSVKPRISEQSKASLPVEEGQLSSSLAQRLGPPVQRNSQWLPPWKRNPGQRGPARANQQQLGDQQPIRAPGEGRGRGRRRGRSGRGRNNRSKRHSQTSDPALLISVAFGDGISTAETNDPQRSSVITRGPQLAKKTEGQHIRRKSSAHVDGANIEPKMMSVPKPATSQELEGKKVMIGSSLRKVWIPLSVYMEVFKELEPQKAIVPVLHALFPISTLSCSAITGNPARGIQQLDPNKIEALREFLAEMFPQYDVSVRGVAWAQCLGVINNITKGLFKKKIEKPSHQPEKIDGRPLEV